MSGAADAVARCKSRRSVPLGPYIQAVEPIPSANVIKLSEFVTMGYTDDGRCRMSRLQVGLKNYYI